MEALMLIAALVVAITVYRNVTKPSREWRSAVKAAGASETDSSSSIVTAHSSKTTSGD